MGSGGPGAQSSMVVAASSPLAAISRGAAVLSDVVGRLHAASPVAEHVHIGVGPGNLTAAALATADLAWDLVHVYQLEEMVAADGDAGRFDEALRIALGRVPLPPDHLHLLPSGATDVDAGALAYDREVAATAGRLDVVVTTSRPAADGAFLAPVLAVDPGLLEGAIELRLEVRRPAAAGSARPPDSTTVSVA